MGFVHTLIKVKILVLVCALRLVSSVLFYNHLKACGICRILQRLKKRNVTRKAFTTTAYLELHCCFAWVSDFKLQNNNSDGYGSPVSYNQPLQSLRNNNIIETITLP